jgi:hypothetical protein
MSRGLLMACLAAVLILAKSGAGAQTDSPQIVGTGNLRTDLFGFTALQGLSHSWRGDSTLAPATERKSPILAAGLSLVVPGAGEFYSGTYWKAALFLAAEAAMWSLAYYYNKRGDRGTNDFNAFADAHWNVVRYITYTLKNLVPSGSQYQLWKTGAPPPSNVQDPWDYVNWSELNRMEHDVSATSEGSFYSHTLPVHGDQQYYEEIGKYEQFNSGWDDVNPNLPPDYATIKANESANALSYTYQRAQANGFYTKAATFVAVALVNHLVSAVDAALSASAYNRAVHAEVGVQTVPYGAGYVQVPVVKLLVNF